MTVRTRFAPSPTGQVHIGNLRAAIYNWLYARHAGGQCLLRIEDTDRERSTPAAVQAVLEALAWLGLTADEPPLYQSARTAAHLAAAEDLLRRGRAYKADKGGTGQGECVLFRMPGTDMHFHDEIKGDLAKPAADLQDFVIVRSNGTPVFHLANVVDDIAMRVTHVIRGDDHVENTFRHVALFQALGAPAPKYAHLPMIVNAQGKPYSKRDGAAYVGDFRAKGYLPAALLNYLALLGWSPGDDRELLSRDELVRLFTLERVQSSPAQMDPVKLQWMNGEYMRALPRAEREAACRAVLEARGLWNDALPADYLGRVLEVLQERVKLFTDIAAAGYFFTEDYPYDEAAVQKRLRKPGAREALAAARSVYAALTDFSAAATEKALRDLAAARGASFGDWVHPVRVAVSGTAIGPSLFHLLEVLGQARTVQRMAKTLEKFGG
ncbi:MAG: glutamate--tRNA ligase family protein [Kiritimatiellaeota bacterium]|nr:glutamate--tRNA ligase family protein [Kiritimatiellota bacterium]